MRGPLLYRNLVHSKLGNFEVSAQEPTVRLSTQPTGSSDLRLKEIKSSNQCIVAPSEFPTVFRHEPTTSTSASTGRTVAGRHVGVHCPQFQNKAQVVLDLQTWFSGDHNRLSIQGRTGGEQLCRLPTEATN